MRQRETDRVLRIVRESVDRGLTVEIEGLGTFRRAEAGGYLFEPQSRPRVFVAYAAEDLKLARRVCASLERAGCAAWLDKDKLLPGQNWPRALERAIENSDAFVACFSPRSIAKRGQFQSELRYALDCARRLPLDHLFVVPVRFEPCAVPRRISDQVQYVDLFPDWNLGVKRVVRAVRKAAKRRAAPHLCA
jgi:TIR domain